MKQAVYLALAVGLFLLAGCPGPTGPEVTIVFPADGATLGIGIVKIKAVATDEDGVTKVEFYDGSTKIGEDNAATEDTFDIDWTTTAGAHTLKAKAFNSSGASSQDQISVTVTAGSGPTNHAGEIDTNETWWPSGNPHVLTADVWPGNNVTITIKPGCIVKFDAGVEFYCGYSQPGAIVAEGTADSTILFTSNVASPAAGDWKAVEAWGQAMPTTSFKYCRFEYGGSDDGYGTIYFDDYAAKFTNCKVWKSGSYGLRLTATAYFAQCADDTITQCAKNPIYISADNIRTIGTGMSLSGNTVEGVYVNGGQVKTTGTWQNLGVPYIVSTDIEVGDNTNTPTLTIAPGTTLKLESGVEFSCGYGQPGAIIAEGKADSVILFTSNVATPAPGDWKAIELWQQTMNTTSFKYCRIEYAGTDDGYGSFYADDFGVKFSNCKIWKSGSYGMHLTATAYFSQCADDTITQCAKNPIYISADNVRTIGSGMSLSGNTVEGVYVNGGQVKTTGTWQNFGVPYNVAGDVNIGDDANSPVVTIAAGTTLKLQNGVEFYCGWSEAGGLVADGTAGRIRFISSVPTPSRGDWASVGFYSNTIDAVSKLVNCTVEYGGANDYGNVRIEDALPTVSGDSLGHSKAYGIWLAGSEYPDPATLRANNTFYDNPSGDIREP